MAMMKARGERTTTTTAWALAFPVVICAILLDIVLNYTIFAVLMWDFPRMGEYTFSQRLVRLAQQQGWRGIVARWIAEKLLDPHDPSGKHIR